MLTETTFLNIRQGRAQGLQGELSSLARNGQPRVCSQTEISIALVSGANLETNAVMAIGMYYDGDTLREEGVTQRWSVPIETEPCPVVYPSPSFLFSP